MKNTATKTGPDMIFYSIYCRRCYRSFVIKQVYEPCPICSSTDIATIDREQVGALLSSLIGESNMKEC